MSSDPDAFSLSASPTSAQGAAGGPASRYAVLHVSQFPLHALLRTQPDLLDQPVGLLDGARKRAVLIAASEAALRAGVELGMTAPQALARCSRLVLKTPEPPLEKEASALLLAGGFSLSPAVEATSPGVCTIDLQGVDPALQEAHVDRAVEHLRQQGLPATGGIGPTPLLALYAAQGTERLQVVTQARRFLADLPLATAEPPPALQPILAGWGLKTLGDLAALSKAEITQRLGPEGLSLWERASGEATRPLRRAHPPQEFKARFEFEHEIETLDPLLFILRRLLDRLSLELRNAGLSAAEIFLGFTFEDESRYERSFRLPEPSAEAELLFRVLHTHLESLHTESTITGLALELQPTRPLNRQQGLFETGLRDPYAFAETMARAMAVVGSGRVGTPALDNTHRPDAVTLTPPPPVVPPVPPPPALAPVGLPLRRFRPPLSATVALEGRAPTFLVTEAVQGAVVQAVGPWRGSGEWWQADLAWNREEWDITLDSGGLYRVIHTPAGWYLEGEYD